MTPPSFYLFVLFYDNDVVVLYVIKIKVLAPYLPLSSPPTLCSGVEIISPCEETRCQRLGSVEERKH